MAGTGILTFEGCSPTEPCFQWSSWVWCSGQLFKQHSPAFLHGRCSSTAGRESPSETIPWTRQLGGRGVRPDKKQAFPWNISNLRQMYSWFGWSNMAPSPLCLNLPLIGGNIAQWRIFDLNNKFKSFERLTKKWTAKRNTLLKETGVLAEKLTAKKSRNGREVGKC